MDSTRETPRSLDDLLEPGSTLMVGTRARNQTDLEFRPLTVARVADDQIQVLLDTNEQWVADLVPPTPVEVTLSDTRTNDWAHLRGTATLTHDPALIDELWNPFADAYFEDGRDTPGIAVLRVETESGRYWSSPSGRVGSLIATIKAKVSGAESAGDHGPITS
jgi:general stress protein 26